MSDRSADERVTCQVYRVHYAAMDGLPRCVDTTKGVWIAGEGFWVDKNWQLTHALDDCLYWIPPSRIVTIEKLHGVRW